MKSRIASTAATFTFGLAALGGTVVAMSAPAYAEPGSTISSSGELSPSTSNHNTPGLGTTAPSRPTSEDNHNHYNLTRTIEDALGLPYLSGR